jgi:hypothetical protein
MSITELFWSKVQKAGPDECWLWTGDIRPNGVCRLRLNAYQSFSAARLSYELARGPIPEGRKVTRTCNAPTCVNPSHLTTDYAARFWLKVGKGAPDECWTWNGGKDRAGYGVFTPVRGTGHIAAHRYAYELEHGAIPEGAYICHTCDNPSCVNPSHLFAGTQADNARDAFEKGRTARGAKSGHARLTDAQVLEIRHRYERGGISQQALADEYGVTQTNIGLIVRRKNWKHL